MTKVLTVALGIGLVIVIACVALVVLITRAGHDLAAYDNGDLPDGF